MKKIFFRLFVLCVLIAVIFSVSACSDSKEADSKEKKLITYLIADAHQAQLIECFRRKDKESIKGYLSINSLANSKDIDEQIEEAFALFDGEIVYWDEEPDEASMGAWGSKCYGASSHVMTDKGTDYCIDFSGSLTGNKMEKIGLDYICVKKGTGPKRGPEAKGEQVVIGDITTSQLYL